MDPRNIVSRLLSGEDTAILPKGKHEALIVAEQAIGEGHTQLIENIVPHLNEIESHIVEYRYALLANDADAAQQSLTAALSISRSNKQRDHLH